MNTETKTPTASMGEIFVEVLDVLKKSGEKSAKTGKPWSMEVAQCAVRSEQGLLVGELTLPRDYPTPAKGVYKAEFEVVRGFDGKIYGGLKALHPVKASAYPKN
jgi:hypothetical protein